MANDFVDMEAWKKKRRNTVLAYMSVYFLRGLEQSANTATLWIYLTKVIKTNNEDLYYGLINIAVYIPPILFSSVVARYADKTRRIKLFIIITNFVAMLGSMIYIVPWSPLFPFVGKFLNGAVIVSRPLMIGEMARSFPSDELQRKLPYLVCTTALGFVTGPIIVLPFANLNIWFGKLHITYGNISGVILLVLTIIVQFLVICFAHDLSREYDMKEAISIGETSKQRDTRSNALMVLKKALSSNVIVVIFIISFSGCLLNIAFFRGLPILVLDILSMPYETVSCAFAANGIVNILLYILSIKIKMGNLVVYFIGIASQVSIITVSICQYIFAKGGHEITFKIGMLVLYVASLTVFEMGEELFIVVVFAKLVSSKHQSYLESIRLIPKQFGNIFGAFLSLIFIKSASIFMPLSVIVNLVLLFFLYLFRHVLIHPEILV